jgi:hypothetical protein
LNWADETAGISNEEASTGLEALESLRPSEYSNA